MHSDRKQWFSESNNRWICHKDWNYFNLGPFKGKDYKVQIHSQVEKIGKSARK